MSDTLSGLSGTVGLPDAAARARALRRRTRLEHRALLAAVLLIVMLVTLPRLHGIALRENELDALRALELLAPDVFAAEAPPDLGAFLAEHESLERRLADVELLAGGRLVLRHGYLFELAEQAGQPCLRAWPYEHGRTGLGAFVSLPGPRPRHLAHSNEGARWSGPERGPRVEDDGAWRGVRLPGTRTESY